MIQPMPMFILLAMRQLCGVKDRHRPGYWRDYHARNGATRRPYLARKRREYRAEGRAT